MWNFYMPISAHEISCSFLAFSGQGLYGSIHKFFVSGECNYQGTVRVSFSLLHLQGNAASFFSKEKMVVLLSSKLLQVSLKNRRKKIPSCISRWALCQNIADVRIHFKEQILCIHLNSLNLRTFKLAELKPELISCCFSSLTYFIVPVGFLKSLWFHILFVKRCCLFIYS